MGRDIICSNQKFAVGGGCCPTVVLNLNNYVCNIGMCGVVYVRVHSLNAP